MHAQVPLTVLLLAALLIRDGKSETDETEKQQLVNICHAVGGELQQTSF